MTGKRATFQFGDWLVHPHMNSVENGADVRKLEPRAMDVLVVLCKAMGDIVSSEDLLSQCWGSKLSGDNPVHKVLNQLRRVLGDNSLEPRYIETIRKRGYRAVAAVNFEQPLASSRDWQGSSPFRGLLAFDEAYTDVFFGRDDVTAKLAATVRSQAAAGFAMTLLLGPSGSGKTSLVRAGLFPALARPGPDGALLVAASTSFDLAEQGSHSLFTALAGALLDMQWQDRPLFEGDSTVSLGQRLEHDAAAVVDALQAQFAAQPDLRCAVFIDRFEAVFDTGRIGDAERRDFLALLERFALSSAVLVVIGCRNDFYPHLADSPILMRSKANGGHFDLMPATPADIAQMIRMPARLAGLSFGVDPATHARLDDILCDAVAGSPDALPMLQYCLHELYRMRTDDGELSLAALHELGGVDGAVAHCAEQVVTAFDEAQKASLAYVMSLVVVLNSEEQAGSRRAPWSALRNDKERQVVNAFIDARLFVSDLAGTVPSFGIAHEALLRRWPRMKTWIDTHREALLLKGRLAQATLRWVDDGRRRDLLLPKGKQLDEARGLQRLALLALTPDEEALIHSSARRAKFREWVRMLAIGAIASLALLASGLGFFAMNAQRLAEHRRVEAEGLMGYMLGDFADKLRPLGRLELLDSVSAKALQYLGQDQTGGLDAEGLSQRVKALQVIGEVRRARGDPKAALDALQHASAILERQREAAPRDVGVIKNLGVNAYWMGQISKDQNNLDLAAKYWRSYQESSQRLNELEPGKVEWLTELSYAHNNLGSLATARGDGAGAAEQFRLSIALKQQVLARTPNAPLVAAELADSYSWLATAHESMGELAAAQQLYAQEMQLIVRLREAAPNDALWIKREARALQHRAAIRLALGADQAALGDYRQAKYLFTDILKQDHNNRVWQGEVANLEQDELSVAARASPAQALPRMRLVHDSLQALTAFDPKNVHWARREAVARQRIGAVELAGGRAAEAQEQAGRAIASLNALYARSRSNLSVRMALADALLLAADSDFAVRQGEPAVAACRQAYDIVKADANGSNYQLLLPWIRANHCLGHVEAADIAIDRLNKLGYRDSVYLHYLANHQKEKQ